MPDKLCQILYIAVYWGYLINITIIGQIKLIVQFGCDIKAHQMTQYVWNVFFFRHSHHWYMGLYQWTVTKQLIRSFLASNVGGPGHPGGECFPHK